MVSATFTGGLMKALTKIDQRLRQLKTPQTSEQLAEYFGLSIVTVRTALRELRNMGDVRRFIIKGKWHYTTK